MELKDLLVNLEFNSYICSMCDKKVYPIIKNVDLENLTLESEQTKYDLRGGLGNKILKDNICPICMAKSKSYVDTMTKIKML